MLREVRNAALVAAFFISAADACAQAGGADAELVSRGRDRYAQICAQCHGRNLVNAGVVTYDLRRFPLDQRDRFQNSVTNGKGNMPSFKGALSEVEIDSLWAYIASRGRP